MLHTDVQYAPYTPALKDKIAHAQNHACEQNPVDEVLCCYLDRQFSVGVWRAYVPSTLSDRHAPLNKVNSPTRAAISYNSLILAAEQNRHVREQNPVEDVLCCKCDTDRVFSAVLWRAYVTPTPTTTDMPPWADQQTYKGGPSRITLWSWRLMQTTAFLRVAGISQLAYLRVSIRIKCVTRCTHTRARARTYTYTRFLFTMYFLETVHVVLSGWWPVSSWGASEEGTFSSGFGWRWRNETREDETVLPQ